MATKKILIIVASALFALTGFSGAQADVAGEHHTFYVDKQYDAFQRSSVPATLMAVGAHAYIYVEDAALEKYGGPQNPTLLAKISSALSDFDTTVYPADTAFWGSEPNPGIDNDSHITILFEQLGNGTGGYTDTSNLYPSSANQSSNQREMISIAADTLLSGNSQVYLSHELEHLISANQKTLLRGVVENTWLDELRAQYSISVAGYNTPFAGSDLEEREQDFLNKPNDSLTEWRGTLIDYASITLFGHYLVEHYGPAILQDTLHNSLTGIDSINAWLSAHGYTENFADVFGNWAVADYLDATSADPRFGYTDSNLASIHVQPIDNSILNYPLSQFGFFLKPWQPEWYKFVSPSSLPDGDNLRISWDVLDVSFMYIDNLGNVRRVANGDVIPAPAGGSAFTLIPYDHPVGSSSSSAEPSVDVSLSVEFVSAPPTPATVADGTLIIAPGESDVYVVTGAYKRLLVPGVPAFYGLDVSKAVHVSQATFDSYKISNYVRALGEKKVYTVWPDGTKHWLNISAQVFSDTGRDWNSIFTINDAELNFYKTGADITN